MKTKLVLEFDEHGERDLIQATINGPALVSAAYLFREWLFNIVDELDEVDQPTIQEVYDRFLEEFEGLIT